MQSKFKKSRLILREYLQGARYFNALKAMNFAETFHTGTRKDGVTPEFDHQIRIALYALTLPDLIDREGTITTIILHDTPEDYDVATSEIHSLFDDKEFAFRVGVSVELLTKTYRGIKKDPTQLFAAMAQDARASIAKPCDRIHNLSSMVGVFSRDKQQSYIAEAEEFIIPMAKTARNIFPRQRMAYENIKWMMGSQIELLQLSLEGK